MAKKLSLKLERVMELETGDGEHYTLFSVHLPKGAIEFRIHKKGTREPHWKSGICGEQPDGSYLSYDEIKENAFRKVHDLALGYIERATMGVRLWTVWFKQFDEVISGAGGQDTISTWKGRARRLIYNRIGRWDSEAE